MTESEWPTHTHICIYTYVSVNWAIIGSDYGLLLAWDQAIIKPRMSYLLIRPLGMNFSEILIKMQVIPFRKMHLNTSSAEWQPFCLRLKMLRLKQGPNSLQQQVMPWQHSIALAKDMHLLLLQKPLNICQICSRCAICYSQQLIRPFSPTTDHWELPDLALPCH